MKAKLCGVAFLIFVLVLSGCASPVDTAYLTPIPQATLFAYNKGTPVENKLQAVIAARLFLFTTRMEFAEPPSVVSVESIPLEYALSQTKKPGATTNDDRPGNTNVWLVIFEGNYQIIPPDPEHIFTPEAPLHGCAYVIVDPNTIGRNEGGSIACP